MSNKGLYIICNRVQSLGAKETVRASMKYFLIGQGARFDYSTLAVHSILWVHQASFTTVNLRIRRYK